MKTHSDKYLELVINRMKERKLNQREVGDEIGVSQDKVSNILNKKRKLEFFEGLKLCRLLGIDPRSIKP